MKTIRIIFYPAIYLVERLPYAGKFILILFLFTAAFSLPAYLTIKENNMQVRMSESELQGLEYIAQIMTLLQDVQRHRGLTSAFIAGDVSFEEAIVNRRTEIEKSIARLRTVENFAVGADVKSRLEGVFVDWDFVRDNWRGWNTDKIFKEHTVVTYKIKDIIDLVGDQTGLMLDSDFVINHLIHATLEVVPDLSEEIGQTRAHGLGLVSDAALTLDDRTRFIEHARLVRYHLENLEHDMDEIFSLNRAADLLGVYLERNREATELLLEFVEREFIAAEANKADKVKYWELSTAAVDSSFRFYGAIVPMLGDILRERDNDLDAQNRMIVALMFVLSVMLIYFLFAVYLSIKSVADIVAKATEDLTEGREVKIEGTAGRDELSKIIMHFSQVANVVSEANRKLAGEVEVLGKMRRELEGAKSALEVVNTGLEERVRERTLELNKLKMGLEQKVKEQTRGLQEKLAELEKYKEATIGRELQMIELKKKIAESEKKQ